MTMPENTQTRSMTIPLVAQDEQYKAIIASIRRVRLAARQAYAVLFAAESAGASIVEDGDGNISAKPDNERSKTILDATFGKSGKAHCYEMREYVLKELAPGIRSFVWDDLRRMVSQRWRAKDPEFTKASRGWLTLQNVRRLAMFHRTGIGCPRAVLCRDALQSHNVTLTWDTNVGEVVFKVGTLDPGRWYRWKRIVGGEWDHGTIVLNERDGKLMLSVSYEAPTKNADLDMSRVMTVRMADDGDSLVLAGPDGATTLDRISLIEARDWCTRLKAQQDRWEARRGACGNPKKPWGEPRRFRAVAGHQKKLTACRTNGVASRNHAWSKRIVTRASDWRCGRIELEIPSDSMIGGHPWEWSHLENVCAYKAQAIGGRSVRTAELLTIE